MEEKEVEQILDELERDGLVFKLWDVKRQEFIWHKTEYGHKIAKEMGLEK